MSTHANRVKMTVTSVASSGTGTITLNAASTGYRSFATAYGANATVDILITEGDTWEIARNCTYTHSGTTVTRGTLESSSTGSAVTFTSAAVVSVVATAMFGNNAALGQVAATVTTGNVTGVVGTMHLLDIDGMTAARDFVLPTVAATGDRIGVFCTTNAPTTIAYVLQIKSGSAGDLINGTDHSSTPWSALFIKGECLIFRCIDGSTVDWVVEHDGRIRQRCYMEAASSQGNLTKDAWATVTEGASGSWNVVSDVGDISKEASDQIQIRRASTYLVGGYFTWVTLSDACSVILGVRKNGTGNPLRIGRGGSPAGSFTVGLAASIPMLLAAGDTIELQQFTNSTGTPIGEWINGESESTLWCVEFL